MYKLLCYNILFTAWVARNYLRKAFQLLRRWKGCPRWGRPAFADWRIFVADGPNCGLVHLETNSCHYTKCMLNTFLALKRQRRVVSLKCLGLIKIKLLEEDEYDGVYCKITVIITTGVNSQARTKKQPCPDEYVRG